MNDVITYAQNFSIVITGLKFGAKDFDVPEKHLRLTLVPSDVSSGTMKVEIRKTNQDTGRGLAKQIVDDLFDDFLLEFAQYISKAVAPVPGSPLIIDASGREMLLVKVADVIQLGSTLGPASYMPNRSWYGFAPSVLSFNYPPPHHLSNALFSKENVLSRNTVRGRSRTISHSI